MNEDNYQRTYSNSNKEENNIMKILKNKIVYIPFIIIFSIFLFFIFPWCFTTVKTYENGVQLNWGKIVDKQIGDGLKFYNPVKTVIKKIDMRERITSIATQTVSKEGLKFGINITVRYQVKEGSAVYLVKNLQTELHNLINSYTNSTIDDIATAKDKNELYSDEGRVAIVKAVKEKLNLELSDYAIINQVIFEDIQLPESITTAIEKQQAALETIKEKENMKQVAEKEADIKRIEAKGIADANNIIQRSLTKEYLQYEAIQKLNPQAQKVFIPSNGILPTLEINN